MLDTIIYRDVDLDSEKQTVENLGVLFCTGDKMAHTFRLTVTRSGTAVDLSNASVITYFIKPDGQTVAPSGITSSNVVSVSLPQACYTARGVFHLFIKISITNEIHTLYCATGSIMLSSTSEISSSSNAIPNLDTLLAEIGDMTDATQDARTMIAALNPHVSGTTLYINSISSSPGT